MSEFDMPLYKKMRTTIQNINIHMILELQLLIGGQIVECDVTAYISRFNVYIIRLGDQYIDAFGIYSYDEFINRRRYTPNGTLILHRDHVFRDISREELEQITNTSERFNDLLEDEEGKDIANIVFDLLSRAPILK